VGKILIPANGPGDWQQFLAEPAKHWKEGYSARTLAHCWHDSDGFPKDVYDVLSTAGPFHDIELLVAIPEHQVPLPPVRGRASQNDIWVLARCATGLVSIAVEGKVGESFGPTLSAWLSTPPPGNKKRLDFLGEILGIGMAFPEVIRYQLLHRTASAIIEAHRFTARHAVLMVHSFSQNDQWFEDYANFVHLFGNAGIRDQLSRQKL
jgi:hypothetical protein